MIEPNKYVPISHTYLGIGAEILKHLKHGGIFVLSHPESPAPWEFRGLSLFSDKSYAAAHIKMYQKL